jgi:hypothetical protein
MAPTGMATSVAMSFCIRKYAISGRTLGRGSCAARGQSIRIIPTWRSGIYGPEAAGEVLLPDADARLGPTTFEEWLTRQQRGDVR